MTIRTREQAVEVAMAQDRNTPGTCQLSTRGWFNAPSAGDQDKDGDYDAVDGWVSEPTAARHPGDRNPPPGVPLSFSGGSKGYGHRCISRATGGNARSTDMSNGRYAKGITGNATIPEIERSMGVHYLGWSETIDGQPIPKDEHQPPKPVKQTRVAIAHRLVERALIRAEHQGLEKRADALRKALKHLPEF
jgi:hypothetical protein